MTLLDTNQGRRAVDIPDGPISDGPPAGLRERKKLATRDALSAAALRLALERGPENVRVDDIAAAAGVSPRTYNNYFSSREEAICVALTANLALRVRGALCARPAGTSLAEAIVDALIAQYCAGEPDQATICLLFSSPALRSEFFATATAMERPLAEAIAECTGQDAARDLFPRVLAGAVSGAARVAAEHWLAAGSGPSLATVLREALSWVAPALRAAATPSNPGEPEC
ncbi:acyl-CoA-like ligand-binding transcription factor [Rugosimonospora acidiphila]|uniref:acyl-CoA-like ligand-binding transcription factor n=1 Tax=Rugosimonospora acidiphila TaxID=556531 RepID=UPI0031ECFB16